MFREMRRKKQELSRMESVACLPYWATAITRMPFH